MLERRNEFSNCVIYLRAMSELLHISDFSLQIDETTVVNNIGFSIDEGELVCIVGESGSGKTVTALSLLGLQPGKITSGKAMFNANTWLDLFSLESKSLHALRGKEIGYVFQEPSLCLNPVIRCGEQVSEVIRTHLKTNAEDAKAETLKWFSKVGFVEAERIYNSFPHQLSGGQKQRVMLCMAMAPKPKLLLADEPTTALDVSVQKQIVELLRSLCTENNTALLFITHDLGLAAAMSSRMIVMHHGEIVEQGPSQKILSAPEQAYTQKLVHTRITLDTPTADKLQAKEEVVVSAKNITATYSDGALFSSKKNVLALNNVSLEIHQGETLGLVGESGSGKSTMAQILMGLKQPDEGTVNLFGKNIYELGDEELRIFRKKFRIIFQDPFSSFNPKISVGNQIQETMTVYNMHGSKKTRSEKTIEWLKKVGLQADDYYRLPNTFSGGQRQRIAIARALACEPDFLVCDECVSSLDVSLQRDILNLLLQLQIEYNMSMLFISHDPATVKFMCENVMVLRNGCVMEYGHTIDVWDNPESEYTRGLLASVV